MIPQRFLALALLALMATVTAEAAVLNQTAGKDNTLYEDLSGSISNGSGSGLFTGKTAGRFPPTPVLIRRALVWFDVSSLPSTAIIDSVFLTLVVTKTNELAGTSVSLHEVQGNWGEGASNAGSIGDGGGTGAQSGDATWIHRTFNSSFWTTPGGDFDPTPSATRTVAGPASYTWNSTPGLVADVQGWVDGTTSNEGWIVIGEESVDTTAKRIESRESVTAANRPTVVIYYTPDMTPALSTTWGAIKQLYR